MSHQTKLPLSEDLKVNFGKAKLTQTNVFRIKIVNEQLELVSSSKGSSTSLDFNGLKKTVPAEEACYIAFRYKDITAQSPWALIAFIPDTCDVKEKMIYATSFSTTRDSLGSSNFSKLKRYSALSDFVWKEFVDSESDGIEGEEGKSTPTTTTTTNLSSNKPDPSKPWNQREKAIHQLEEEEAQARKEFEEINQQKPTHASGFHQVKLPLSEEAREHVNSITSGDNNWVQLSLDTTFTTIISKGVKSLSPGDLPSNVVESEPQFYLYKMKDHQKNTTVLIYCCPDKAPNVKNKDPFRYATCKAELANTLEAIGVSNLKKYDIHSGSELNESAMNAHLRSSVSNMFVPTDKIISPSNNRFGGNNNNNSSSGTANFAASATNSNKPVFNRVNNAPTSNSPATAQRGGVGAVQMVGLGGSKGKDGSLASLINSKGTSPKTLPKGVVLPPSGAYC
eukprot:TRINITY_DN6530_c0_g1_i1.p1 TRINITY_DN6530_c0_g1~~TRINITY_DN6530_c0_g1_i1.p1  ORF type:complete len:451 (-),score=133.21 TRINITY_DN6530_c0_g1_i1:142-1494(-)